MLRILALVVALTIPSARQSVAPLINRSHRSCSIPNEAVPGECRAPSECQAFQDINEVSSLRCIGRQSFLRELQCNDGYTESAGICCPRGNRSYKYPKMNESVPLKERVDTNFLVPRIFTGTDEPRQCGQQSYQVKVIGGQIAEIDEFPWMAMLIYGASSSPGCGGALISSSFVVTAAHCLVGKNVQEKGNLKFVRLGEYDILNDPDCMLKDGYKDCTDGKIDLKPKRYITHPQYNPNSLSQHHDIGLIELPQHVEFSFFIDHICLPEPVQINAVSTPGTKFNVCGWGRTNFFRTTLGENSISPVKLKATVPLVDHQNCQQIYKSQRMELGSGQICAGGRKADSCAGDSGSPLMYYDRKQGCWILTGLVSLGTQKCGTEGRPGIYTKVAEYVSWIRKNAISSA